MQTTAVLSLGQSCRNQQARVSGWRLCSGSTEPLSWALCSACSMLLQVSEDLSKSLHPGWSPLGRGPFKGGRTCPLSELLPRVPGLSFGRRELFIPPFILWCYVENFLVLLGAWAFPPRGIVRTALCVDVFVWGGDFHFLLFCHLDSKFPTCLHRGMIWSWACSDTKCAIFSGIHVSPTCSQSETVETSHTSSPCTGNMPGVEVGLNCRS